MLTRVLLALVVVCEVARADDWPQYRGPNRDGVSREKDWSWQWPAEGPKRLWKASIGIGSASVAISRGRAFTLGWSPDKPDGVGKETLFCFDADTGALQWKESYPVQNFAFDHEGGSGTTPTVDGDFVYTQSRGGHLACFEVATGKLVWTRELAAEFSGKPPFYGYTGSPLVLDDKLIVVPGATNASTVALDKRTGKELWRSGSDPAAYAAPIAFVSGQKKCVAVFNFSGLVAMDAASGKELGRFDWKTMSPRKTSINAPTPIALGDEIFLTSGYGRGCALLRLGADGFKPVWQGAGMRAHYSGPVLHQGHLYGFDNNNEWFGRAEFACADWKTGQQKWSSRSFGWGSVIVAGDKLIVVGRMGELAIADASPAGYKELARTQLIGGTVRCEPAFANGRLYLRNISGDLICVDLRAK